MLRPDVSAAIDILPGKIQQEVQAQSETTLAMLNDHLPKDETVILVSSAAPNWHRAPTLNSLLVLTESRLIFVAPLPQVISWSLPKLTKAQVLAGPGIVGFLVEAEGTDFQLGIDGKWGPTFETRVAQASAIATLRNGG